MSSRSWQPRELDRRTHRRSRDLDRLLDLLLHQSELFDDPHAYRRGVHEAFGIIDVQARDTSSDEPFEQTG